MLTASIIVVTYNRPDYVRRCLTCLLSQSPSPHEIIVVDASQNGDTQMVVNDFVGVMYLKNEKGIGHTVASRNMGLRAATGEIVAYVDDDAYVHENWLFALVGTYTDKFVGAVGGRALNNVPGEATKGLDEIGKLKPNGCLTGNFAADPDRVVEVDHIIGCNMSFRRDILVRLGGLREYAGNEIREETDLCLRVKHLGYRLLFNPKACLDHVAAPRSDGQRFNVRYAYYAQQNHLVMLIRNFGPGATIVWRYFGTSFVATMFEFVKRLAAAFARLGVSAGGTAAGFAIGLLMLSRTGGDPTGFNPEVQSTSEVPEEGTLPEQIEYAPR